MISESWFRSLWKTPRKHEVASQKVLIGVLAFEVASLMSKLVHLWQSLTDKQIARLREEITNSVGIKKLVSDDDEYIVRLISAELIDNMTHVAKAVARLGKKCTDPTLKSFNHAYDDLIQISSDPYGWIFTWKKMERKVKKMERFISANANLYQETEMLADLEQTLRRMESNDESNGVNLVEFQKKVVRKKQQVKNLREISLWNRTYDYVVLLLARSLFTIFSRIEHVFGIEQFADAGEMNDSRVFNSGYIPRGQSVSSLMQTLIHSENSLARYASGPLRKFTAKLGPASKANKTNNFHSGPLDPISGNSRGVNFYSGPLGGSSTKSGPISGPVSGTNRNLNFFSGPLGKTTTKRGQISGTEKASKKPGLPHRRSPISNGKKPHQKPNRLTQVGPFKGCMISSNSSPVANCYLTSNYIHSEILNGVRDSSADIIDPGNKPNFSRSIINSKRKLLDAPPETLGAAALALHYANVITVIEKLAASPHLISIDARDDLYNMLPTSVRASLRAKLKPYTKSLASSVYDTVLAGEWSEAIAGILEWLAPLAHNMIRWQSERSFEQQNLVSRTNVLLVQTLFFANQEKTESIIAELLVGLNYIWRFGRELNAKALLECESSRIYNEYLDLGG